ncbi:DUF3047 domain-containing protein [Aquabacterium sp. OR-4]|uniref:DUF3047 domain-containing protein n=1 Tax=Aquabacterium sp. OR-4 TaxID=2978127 RepID=UPI0021B28A50|nr:DUF3047 domain-containing protein [Aquabacterium sp. OR-4]MDT7836316.1 DUF3047 domain-containing protein [Aquabacterium sp. OR-4]
MDGVDAAQRRRWLRRSLDWCAVASLGSLGGCATWRADEPGHTGHGEAVHALPPATQVLPFSQAEPGQLPAGWFPYVLRRDLPRTRYGLVREGDRVSLRAHARRSATGLHCALDIDPAQQGRLQFSWKVAQVHQRIDVAQAELDDCPARLIVAFDGDHQRLPLRERLFFDQVELFTGQRLPYAMLMYVWDGGRHAVESVHRNHRSSRIQYLTVESGSARAGQWLHYQRDVAADFRRVYGEAPGQVIGVGVLTDGDALKIDHEAWYGDISIT